MGGTGLVKHGKATLNQQSVVWFLFSVLLSNLTEIRFAARWQKKKKEEEQQLPAKSLKQKAQPVGSHFFILWRKEWQEVRRHLAMVGLKARKGCVVTVKVDVVINWRHIRRDKLSTIFKILAMRSCGNNEVIRRLWYQPFWF